MSNNQIDEKVIHQDGPFVEFKQDVSIISVELESGEKYHKVPLLYPNKIIGMKGENSLPFDPSFVRKIFQTNENLSERADMSWAFS